jgi:DnaJ-domain-containing protein 1
MIRKLTGLSFSYNRSSSYHDRNGVSNSNIIKDINKYYEILESKLSDFLTIKNNYRRLIKEYYYDTISSKNFSQEMLDFEEDKLKNLMKHTEQLKK